MRKLLITGGAGFIGGNFTRFWRDRHADDEVVVLDALTYAGNRETIADVENITFVHGDIRNGDLVRRIMADRNIDTIVHFAAETHVDRSIGGPEIFTSTNVVGTQSLLEAARETWLSGSGRPHRFHHVSTDEVYGTLGAEEPAFTEISQLAPNSPYAASKASSDHLVRAYHRTFGLDAVTTRCSNNYGPFQYPEKLLPLFLINAVHGRALPLYGDGRQVRDWLHVGDHCYGVEAALDHGAAGEVYNLGGGVELENMAIVMRLCRAIDRAFASDSSLAARYPDAPPVTGKRCEDLIVSVADRPGHDRRYAIDDSKARRQLGYVSKQDFDTGLEEAIAWYLENSVWWKGLVRV